MLDTTPDAASSLEEQVTSVFAHHPHLAGQNLHCHALGGCVTLEGTVGSYYQKQVAQEAIRGMNGVVSSSSRIASEVGIDIMKQGGNAIDAAVAAPFAATVVAPYQCGIGGYGGHMTVAPAGQRRDV